MRLLLCAALLTFATACETGGCHDIVADVGEVCLPSTLAPDQQTTIQVRELCGPGCSHPPGCTAVLRNGVLELDVRQEICDEAAFANCISLPCSQRIATCKLPDLAAGDYTVVAPGAPRRVLHVGADGAGACVFPGDGGT